MLKTVVFFRTTALLNRTLYKTINSHSFEVHASYLRCNNKNTLFTVF